ncbi:MAG: hypothetical protein FWC39_13490 [Bacteroidetes bacterium]|nr:hypothetical protein [Bacteroidota bacterium]
MATAVLNKPKERVIDWVNPDAECSTITLEEYRNEMMAAEKSGFISFEDHKKNMNQWLTARLQ